MDVFWKNNGPVVVGGLGGSGTRVVAELMAMFGFYIGSDLNSARDNLWYSFLFKRPAWYPQHREDGAAIATGLSLFEKLMLRQSRPTLRELCYLIGAFRSMSVDGFSDKHLDEGRPKWALRRVLRMLINPGFKDEAFVGWGWKEPNSHLLINDLADHFGNFKYIHTIRHGLDMAFSAKQAQMHLWGPLFGVELPAWQEDSPPAAYRFWVNANRQAIDNGRKLGQERFLLVNYDRLCADPANEVGRIISFLQITPDQASMDKACALVRPQKTSGRYLKHDVEMFRGENLDALHEFGFPPVEMSS